VPLQNGLCFSRTPAKQSVFTMDRSKTVQLINGPCDETVLLQNRPADETVQFQTIQHDEKVLFLRLSFKILKTVLHVKIESLTSGWEPVALTTELSGLLCNMHHILSFGLLSNMDKNKG
jgi:hypothetical protein